MSAPVDAPVSPYAEAVAAWQEHLRAGGTTTWAQFRDEGGRATPAHPLPDAVHLELLRRLNQLPGGQDPRLHDLVLRTAAPGRGALDVPLAWPTERPRFGTPPVEPDQLPDEELVRLATGVLARLLPGLPPRPPEAAAPRRWPLPWRRRVRVHGSPGTSAAVRRMLVARGAVESDWHPVHVVVARPLDVMMAEHWTAATHLGAVVRWSTVWRRARSVGLPGGVDLARTVDRLGARGDPVHVVVSADLQQVAATAARVVGVREAPVTWSAELAQTDLQRRLNRLLAVTEGPPRVRELTARLRTHVLATVPPPVDLQLPFVPAAARAWAEETASAAAAHLREAGYPVHGDLATLVPQGEHTGPEVVDRSRVLEVALHALASCVDREAPHPAQEGQERP